ncbi:MAG: DUF368 domain-containing protein [Planctomycetaceae bacterium]
MHNTDVPDQPASPPVGVADMRMIGCGVLMGAADIVPGVSGGTVALILGIYNRLVTAISRFDSQLLRYLVSRQWLAAVRYADLRFLGTLGAGIVTGIGGLSFLMHFLLENQPQHTNGVFFGLILGSGIIVGRGIERWPVSHTTAFCLGAAGTFLLLGLETFQQPPDSLWYLFLCGMVGICAMILPGISGAFILLILGTYQDVTGLLRSCLTGLFQLLKNGAWEIDPAQLLAVAVFCIGCLTGLLVFSRFLRWLLLHYRTVTLAGLCGLMLGSLRKIWPFKVDLTPEETRIKFKQFSNVMPEHLDSATALTVILLISALVAVLVLETGMSRRRHPVLPDADSADSTSQAGD